MTPRKKLHSKSAPRPPPTRRGSLASTSIVPSLAKENRGSIKKASQRRRVPMVHEESAGRSSSTRASGKRPVLIDLVDNEQGDEEEDDVQVIAVTSTPATTSTMLPRCDSALSFVLNPAFRDLFTPTLPLSSRSPCAMPSPLATRVGAVGPAEHIWQLLVTKERIYNTKSPALIQRHPKLTDAMRTVLVDWIMEVCDSERLHRETFHLAVDYLDRYLSLTVDVDCGSLQLVGVTALFLAAKNEEIYPPKIEQFASYTDGACNEMQMRGMEMAMLTRLTWALTPITAIHWLSIYMQILGDAQVKYKEGGEPASSDCTRSRIMRDEFIALAQVHWSSSHVILIEVLDLCLMDIASLRFSNSVLAASVIFCAYEPERLIQRVTGYSLADLCDCSEWVEPFVIVCENHRVAGDPLPQMDEIPSDQVHNIQTHSRVSLDEVRHLRKTMLERRRDAALVPRKKRAFSIADP